MPSLSEMKNRKSHDFVICYGLQNVGRNSVLSANLTFDVVFIEAKKRIKKGKEKTTQSLTVQLDENALGSRGGASTFNSGVTTAYEPGAMLSSRREPIEIRNLGSLQTAWIYFVNRGNAFVHIYFPQVIEGVSVEGGQFQSVKIDQPFMDGLPFRVPYGELMPASYHWEKATLAK
jgi:hypothetical protein